MAIDDLRYMRQGRQVYVLNEEDRPLIEPVNDVNGKRRRGLLLIHGFSSSPAVFRLFIPHLTKTYDGIHCPILHGHADSIEEFSKVKANDWLTQVEQQYEELNAKYKTVDVLGLSLGGLLACHLSKKYDLSHLYLLAPALNMQFSIAPMIKFTQTMHKLGFSSIRSFGGNIHRITGADITYRQLPLPAIIELLTLIKDFNFVAPRCPTDLFLGVYDKVIKPISVAERFNASEQTKIHWLGNSAHTLTLDGDMYHIINRIKENNNKP